MKDIGTTNLHPSYFQIKPFAKFEKCMKDIGFEGDFEAAYKKGGGVVDTKAKKKGE